MAQHAPHLALTCSGVFEARLDLGFESPLLLFKQSGEPSPAVIYLVSNGFILRSDVFTRKSTMLCGVRGWIGPDYNVSGSAY